MYSVTSLIHAGQREKSETVVEYVAALRKLAEHCNFGETLDEMLRDRLVCGIANPAIQKRWLTESELTFTKAVSRNFTSGSRKGI